MKLGKEGHLSKEGDHHYVPQLLLRNWRVKKQDCKVKVWKRVAFNGNLHFKYWSTAQFGYQRGLYRLEDVGEHDSQFIEREVFGNQIENRAARILAKLARQGAASLSHEERDWWAVFLNAFRVRHPEDIADLKAQTAKVFQDVTSDVQFYIDDVRSKNRTAEEWFDSCMPGFRKNLHWDVGGYLLRSDKLLGQLLALHWHVFDIARADQRLLLGDRPLLVGSYEPSRSPFFAMPITPTKLFIAGDFAAITYLKSKHVQDLVIFINIGVLRQVTCFVCGNAEEQFLDRYLPR